MLFRTTPSEFAFPFPGSRVSTVPEMTIIHGRKYQIPPPSPKFNDTFARKRVWRSSETRLILPNLLLFHCVPHSCNHHHYPNEKLPSLIYSLIALPQCHKSSQGQESFFLTSYVTRYVTQSGPCTIITDCLRVKRFSYHNAEQNPFNTQLRKMILKTGVTKLFKTLVTMLLKTVITMLLKTGVTMLLKTGVTMLLKTSVTMLLKTSVTMLLNTCVTMLLKTFFRERSCSFSIRCVPLKDLDHYQAQYCFAPGEFFSA